MQSDVKIYKMELTDGFNERVNAFCKAMANPEDGTPPRKLVSTFVYDNKLCLVMELAE